MSLPPLSGLSKHQVKDCSIFSHHCSPPSCDPRTWDQLSRGVGWRTVMPTAAPGTGARWYQPQTGFSCPALSHFRVSRIVPCGARASLLSGEDKAAAISCRVPSPKIRTPLSASRMSTQRLGNEGGLNRPAPPPRPRELIKFSANKALLSHFVSVYRQMKRIVISRLLLKVAFIETWKEMNLLPENGLTREVAVSRADVSLVAGAPILGCTRGPPAGLRPSSASQG